MTNVVVPADGWDAPFGVSVLVRGHCDPARTPELVRELASAAPDRPLEILFLADLDAGARQAATGALNGGARELHFLASATEVHADTTPAADWRDALELARGGWIYVVDASEEHPGETLHALLREASVDRSPQIGVVQTAGADSGSGRLSAPVLARPEVVRDRGLREDAPAPAPNRRRLIATLSGLAVDLAIFGALLAADVHYLGAAVISAQVALIWLFVLTDRWVCVDARPSQSRRTRLFAFLVVNETILLLRIPILLALAAGLSLSAVSANLLTLIAFAVARSVVTDDWIWGPLWQHRPRAHRAA